MGKSKLATVDHLVRTLHLYTGLFLVPWMIVYAASAFFLNHGPWFREVFDITPPHLETLRQIDFAPDDSFPQARADQAKAILQLVDLDGPHFVPPKGPAHQLVIRRFCGTGIYVITWRRNQSVIVVQQQQPFSYFRLVNYLHFRGGYAQPYFAMIAWAVVVDCVAVSMMLWVVSGVYIWARRPSKRVLGGVSLLGGGLLFVWLVILLCR